MAPVIQNNSSVIYKKLVFSILKTILIRAIPFDTLFLDQNKSPVTGNLHITRLIRIFVMLIEKDGGIRPCEVLTTCAYKVPHSTRPVYQDGRDR